MSSKAAKLLISIDSCTEMSKAQFSPVSIVNDFTGTLCFYSKS